ncbi:single-stranded DNA-binding protein [Gulosibacter faecalis]|jgi:single-strand DNA-binding protein|uniref:Single-stranded DNA-binding protein n=1 Tax=Gulosibacter faecalis TaxID=272240 RepID=A0ABW5UZQ4_9MICO|nr:single-stranded DNA-binding protein [Gulosibacter faecalis]
MSDHLTITGTLGTDPEHRTVGNNLSRLTFRVATSERRQTPAGEWEDAHTNWYSVTAFGRLADNARGVLRKGQRVVVTGKFRLSNYERQDGSTGTSAEIIAAHLGPDLAYASRPRDEATPAAASGQARAEPTEFDRPASTPTAGTDGAGAPAPEPAAEYPNLPHDLAPTF